LQGWLPLKMIFLVAQMFKSVCSNNFKSISVPVFLSPKKRAGQFAQVAVPGYCRVVVATRGRWASLQPPSPHKNRGSTGYNLTHPQTAAVASFFKKPPLKAPANWAGQLFIRVPALP
jgi:hypothetical protein